MVGYSDILKAAQQRLVDIITAINKGDSQELEALIIFGLYSGDEEFTWSKPKADEPAYHYTDGTCFFMIDGIEVEVQDLRSMRKSHLIDKETYSDVCVCTISHSDDDGIHMYHVVPNSWLYGSTSHEFDEGKPVHHEFILAAREYIEEHHITPGMQHYTNEVFEE